ncbi:MULTISPECIES: dTDP-4-dehydrorhamnose reductase [unclassified Pseudomonas]|jgi:dTDP-4-dehydrorhamnose reductase|uniref:dTDP-4-dehydrorhamnose reductase n=1 Tax=unclassified Pseudomonas TaxID=196821 RepID=UPI0008C08181|nr:MULTISPECIES: dTDP-4-dehydrorhamnose reductase [unclassified Pseudomonas]PMV27220.1 dTDP-4-dehydrorhamnose reductase [Pseudomonas sp. FW305-3-2-15-C-TSA2]PMV32475.1 dTDP-4-dehydrorhamnose reductase [Pseudomonas sp. DP16D-L5]PMV42189.1 dTDP-4-dehydrorhamnose reductase [Pseudomonas sp. FW305-3-2-15-A-LB2]PMV49771.1 dTDP-4-dehydrorhamnose reductase [Pseudomonas sp. FW305-3-2-15-C-R2A1]PMV55113.1 dTDP-4-dehydrorhamnose reductase [Pseudomonas sp. FW305-3-2-15-C-LB1]
MKILICGQHGQVSRELQQRLQGLGELIVLGRDQLDLANAEQIRQQVRAHRPSLIINAAAHTAVDQAESEPDAAFAINAIAPGILAEEAKALGIPLIHYSTDYVFDGSKPAPYTEADTPNPLGVYGQSKLAGEQAIAAVGGQYLVLRTSWVYSNHGKNFLLTMQRLLQEKPQMRIVADQIGAPTWAGSIANSTLALIERWQAGTAGEWGVYHLTAQGETSWFGFAEAIGEHLRKQGKACAELEAIPSSAYPTPAQRPLNSRLDCSRLQQQWHVSQPQWQDALRECLAQQH